MCYNNVKICKMTLEDLYRISDILISDFDDFWPVNTLEQELKSENSYYLVAKINNEIVGFAGIKMVLNEADIMNIVTRKNYRNHGIGSILFQEILKYAKQKSIEKLTLEVNENNHTAIHIYEKYGFKKIATRKNYYHNNDTAVIMQLSQ